MKIRVLVPAAVLALGSLSGGAMAQNAPDDRVARGAARMDRMMQRVDADGDGAISRAELEAAGTARFGRLDSDGDGLVSLDEMLARAHRRSERPGERRAGRVARRFARLDVSGDGMLDPGEHAARIERFFERADANRDGVVDRVELDAVRARRAGHRERRRDRPGGRPFGGAGAEAE